MKVKAQKIERGNPPNLRGNKRRTFVHSGRDRSHPDLASEQKKGTGTHHHLFLVARLFAYSPFVSQEGEIQNKKWKEEESVICSQQILICR